jgi:ABC-type multidrug transport system permease subunit
METVLAIIFIIPLIFLVIVVSLMLFIILVWLEYKFIEFLKMIIGI